MVNSKQIQEITSKGIHYLDDNGSQKFIDFMDCFNTYLKWERSNPTHTKRMDEYSVRIKRVGDINYLGELDDDGNFSLPYVVFYDNHVTYIEFSDVNECEMFDQKVLEAGWTLFDLTD